MRKKNFQGVSGENPHGAYLKSRNGKLRYFKGTGPSSASKIAPGIDVRSDGGYVILPPSICAVTGKGKKGKTIWLRNGQYQWLDEHGSIPDVPDWLLELAKGKSKKTD